LFGGEEIKRGQVRQFIGMLRKPAIDLDMAVLLLSHPSIQGMQSGTGSSGSTAWNNSVRSRLYLTADKDDADLRILTNKKANYGKTGGEIKLRWREGAFILDDGKPSAAAGLAASHDDALFRELLSAVNRSGQRVAPTKGVNYAPAILMLRPAAKRTSKKSLEAAMHRLLAAGIIKVVMDGPPSKQRQKLIVSAEDFGPDCEEE
jgi:RecA-family ATPase